jgi:sulfoxide reductase heme-binding subunit YedZ
MKTTSPAPSMPTPLQFKDTLDAVWYWKLADAGIVVHDWFSAFLITHLKAVKMSILCLAYATILGLLFPQINKSLGNVALLLLLIGLLVSPLSKILQMKLLYQVMGLRRELGIWFGIVALVHGLNSLMNATWFDFVIAPYLTTPWQIQPRYISGLLAFFFTLPLLVTSNKVSVQALKGNWKRVHFLAYPLFVAVLLHILLPRIGSRQSVWFSILEFVMLFGGYLFLKILAKNNFITPLQHLIDALGKRYRTRQLARRLP